MPRSLANGDYRVMAAIQRRGDPGEFYLVQHDLHQPRHPSGRLKLSCDCTEWVFNKRRQTERTCRHIDMVAPLLDSEPQPLPNSRPANHAFLPTGNALFAANPILSSIYGSHYSVVERAAPIAESAGPEPYHWAFIAVTTADGGTASGLVGFAERHGLGEAAIREQTTAWAGYQIAAEFARRSGLALPAVPPGRFRLDDDGRSRRPRARGQAAPAAPPARRYGIGELLQLANQTNLGDGRTPQQRAESLLETFLGGRYARLQQQGYLDVSSKRSPEVFRFAAQRLGFDALPRQWQDLRIVYRLRLDPRRSRDRRIRVFWVDPATNQHSYWKDFCIIRQDTDIPVQDAFVSLMLGLSSSELRVLEVVGQHNIFPPHSDDTPREAPGPAPVWVDRMAVPAA